jgi:hypothetical protein|tara:strand:+ start:442 stop:876 length:435 start_codon:yes stop_codon:yes gene_type:complete
MSSGTSQVIKVRCMLNISSRPPFISMAVGSSANTFSSETGKDSSGMIQPDEKMMAKKMVKTPKRCRTELLVTRARVNERFTTSKAKIRMKNRNPIIGNIGRNSPLKNWRIMIAINALIKTSGIMAKIRAEARPVLEFGVAMMDS